MSTPNEDSSGEESRMKLSRRSLLRLAAGAAVAGGGLSGVSGLASASFSDGYTTSWIGDNGRAGQDKWVQNTISAMEVESDGTVITNSRWDEGGREAGIYRNGDAVDWLPDLHGNGGYAVTSDSSYYYVGIDDNGYGLRRYSKSDHSSYIDTSVSTSDHLMGAEHYNVFCHGLKSGQKIRRGFYQISRSQIICFDGIGPDPTEYPAKWPI